MKNYTSKHNAKKGLKEKPLYTSVEDNLEYNFTKGDKQDKKFGQMKNQTPDPRRGYVYGVNWEKEDEYDRYDDDEYEDEYDDEDEYDEDDDYNDQLNDDYDNVDEYSNMWG